MTVRWTHTGLADLDSVHSYITLDNPGAASRMITSLLEAVDTLARHPGMGRRGRVSGTREFVVTPYVIAYRVGEEAIEIVAVIHSARRWPDRL